MAAKNISLLGSTGSIGKNVLEVVRQFPGRFQVVGLAAGRNIELLRDQIESFNPKIVSIADETLAGDLIQTLDHDGYSEGGSTTWNLVSRNGQEVVSDIYLYSVHSDVHGFEPFHGRFVVIR